MEKAKQKILIVDDEPDIIEFLKYNLKKEGYKVFSASNGIEAIEIASKKLPQLIILDLMMPGIDGLETCERIRNIPKLSNVLITFLSARGEDYSQIAGFEKGADDYITKPIKPKLLVSRIKALLKRYNNKATDSSSLKTIKIEDLIIDREKYSVIKSGTLVQLPKKEFELLVLLASASGKVFDRDEIFSKIWGDDIIVGERTIDVHIRKLREKIGDEYISTVKGVGYKFMKISK